MFDRSFNENPVLFFGNVVEICPFPSAPRRKWLWCRWFGSLTKRWYFIARGWFVCLIHTPIRPLVGECGSYTTSGSSLAGMAYNCCPPNTLNNYMSFIDTLSLDDLSLSNNSDPTLISCPYIIFDFATLLCRVRNDLFCLICHIHGVPVAYGNVGGACALSGAVLSCYQTSSTSASPTFPTPFKSRNGGRKLLEALTKRLVEG